MYIEQYDWNGNPIRKYKLDRGGHAYVDSNENILILISGSDDPFWRYKFPVE